MTNTSVLSASEAVKFLEWLDPVGLHNLVAIDPVTKAVQALSFKMPMTDSVIEWIDARNGRTNLYFSINEPSAEAREDTKLRRDEISHIRAFHVDIDNLEGEPDWDMDCLPSAIIDSGGGRWGFWKLAAPIVLADPTEVPNARDVAFVEAQNRALTSRFHGDGQAHNIDRIARLPGTLNIPNEAKRKKGRVETVSRILSLTGMTYEPAEVAAWCPPLAVTPEKVANDAAPPVDAVSTEADRLAQGIYYLVHEAPPSIEGEHGDATLFQVACQLKNIGIAPAPSVQLLRDFYNPLKAEPEWPHDKLREKVMSAHKNKDVLFGRDTAVNPEIEFEAVDVGESAKPARAMRLERVRDIEPDFAAEEASLVRDWIDLESLSVVYGESNTGKTHVALDMAMAVATRPDWAGYETHKGLVVYVAAEGGRGILKRIKGHKLARPEIDWENAPFELLRAPVNMLRGRRDADAIYRLVSEAEQAHGMKCVQWWLDTLSRTMPGGNENAPEDMTAYVDTVDYVRTKLKAACGIIHHSGKNTAKGARGHSSLRAATDTEIEIANMEISCRKQRDLEGGKTLRFEYRPFVLGKNQRGFDVTTVIADVRQPTEFDQRLLTPQQQRVLDAIRDVITQKTQNTGGPVMPETRPSFARKDLAHLNLPATTLTEVFSVLTAERYIANPKRGLYIPLRMTE